MRGLKKLYSFYALENVHNCKRPLANLSDDVHRTVNGEAKSRNKGLILVSYNRQMQWCPVVTVRQCSLETSSTISESDFSSGTEAPKTGVEQTKTHMQPMRSICPAGKLHFEWSGIHKCSIYLFTNTDGIACLMRLWWNAAVILLLYCVPNHTVW